MKIPELLEEMKIIQNHLLEFLNDEAKESFDDIISKVKINLDKYKLKSFLHLLAIISCNHKRTPNFFSKIEKIILIFKDDIKNYYSNWEIFQIFKNNKKILLFLLEENIMIIDKYIAKNMINGKYFYYNYTQYFAPEIKPYINEKWFTNTKLKEELIKSLPENFNELRKAGENENLICQLIQKDSVVDFIVYVNQNNYSLDSVIESSIYETNTFLLKKVKVDINYLFTSPDSQTTLIEYAAFCGSLQIFNYLRNNKVELNKSLWMHAIHGGNEEIIQILEDNHFELNKEEYKLYLRESIKNHHNDIANYLLTNYIQDEKEKLNYLTEFSIKYYNYELLNEEMINESSFFYLCKYDYYTFANIIMNENEFNVNYGFSESGKQSRWSKLVNFDGSFCDTIIYDARSNETPLFAAVEKENIDIIKLLLSNEEIEVNCGVDEDDGTWGGTSILFSYMSKDQSLLSMAVEKENIDIIKLLLANKKINVNLLDGYESSTGCGDEVSMKITPLYRAVKNENIEIIKLLFSNDKIDPNIPMELYADWQGGGQEGEGTTHKSVLYEAISRHNSEITKFLLSNEKIDVNFVSRNFGDTCCGITFTYQSDDECHWEETALSKALKIFGSEDIEIFKLFLMHKDLKVDKQDIENAKSEEIKKLFEK